MTNQNRDSQRLLREAKAAAGAGYTTQAHMIAHRIIEHDADHEEAWLLLSELEDTQAGRLQALEQVLRINPQNSKAREAAEQLRQTAPQQQGQTRIIPPRPQQPRPLPREQAPAAQQQQGSSAVEQLQPMIEASKNRKHGMRISEVGIFVVGIILTLLIARILLDVLFKEPNFAPAPAPGSGQLFQHQRAGQNPHGPLFVAVPSAAERPFAPAVRTEGEQHTAFLS